MADREGLEQLRRIISVARPHLVVPHRIDRTGARGPTMHAARMRWRRAYAGLYVPDHVVAAPDQRVLEASAVVVGHPAAISGWAALCWVGARWFGGGTPEAQAPVPVTIGTFDRRPRAGIRFSGESLPPAHIGIVDGVRLTNPVRATADEVRRANSDREAVRIASMAAYDDLVSAAELRAYAASCGPLTGIARLREASVLMDENCWSPREVDMLSDWSAAGLPRPLMNVPVFDRAHRHIGTPDLFEPSVGVAVEYDGIVHLDAARRRGDLRRGSIFRRAGIETETIVAGMGPEERMVRMREAYARARAAAGRPRIGRSTPPRGGSRPRRLRPGAV